MALLKGEDQQIQIRDCLKSEVSKLYPDMGKVSLLMALTYSFRRQLVVNKVPVKDIMEEYPALYLVPVQYEEFRRVTCLEMKEAFFLKAEKQGLGLFPILSKKEEKP